MSITKTRRIWKKETIISLHGKPETNNIIIKMAMALMMEAVSSSETPVSI
jgi:hypothetical protein